MFEITPYAAEKIKVLIEAKGDSPQLGLRLSVARGGCAGLQYEMKVAEAEADDLLIEHHGARVWIEQQSLYYLSDCLMDYSDDLTDAGFKIENPNAKRSCGCGTSFEMDTPSGEKVEGSEDDCVTN
jgi:iron-sulfur cluster assembly accessory protein